VQLPESAIDIGVDPGDVNLYGLSYADPDHAWLVGEFGIVMASDDGGRTWHQQHSPVDTTLFGLILTYTRHGWAVGGYRVIIHTEDGGATWMPQAAPPLQRPLYDVFVRDNAGWIVGEAGTILKSTDGGAAWPSSRSPSSWRRGGCARSGGPGGKGLCGRCGGPRLPDRRDEGRTPRRNRPRGAIMIPQRWVQAYLRFLLRNRLAVTVTIALMTVFFAYECTQIKVIPQFLDFYPSESKIKVFGHEFTIRKGHPYINIYNDFRRMFGSANVLTVILEVKHGDIYNPKTLQKLDVMTRWIVETKGVVPYQILSIAHPKMKSITTYGARAAIREVFFPGVPQTQADADRVKFAVYATKGIRGLYVAEDDTAALVHAGFWEEELDFHYLYDRMMELKKTVEDENHTVYITGFPWLYTSVQRYTGEVGQVFVITVAALSFLLWNYFRTWTGIWVPIFSGILSGIWALGLVPVLGLNLDPLILVVPIFLSARALSHSVQSMDRYHEEYHRTHDRHTAIVESYSHLFPPAIASILNDAAGIFLVTLAPIPLIQKVAIFSCFWIFSILISVVTLHPIILSVINPPGVRGAYPEWSRRLGRGVLMTGAALFGVITLIAVHDLVGRVGLAIMVTVTVVLSLWHEQIYDGITKAVILSTEGWRRWAIVGLTVALFIICPYYGWRLKVGDMTPGAALLFPNHYYNVSYAKLNEKFLGASQLVIIADTGKEDGMKDVAPLTAMEEIADHMEAVEGASVSVTVIDIIKQLSRLFHEGEPKWAFVPDRQKFIAELFYQFTQSGQAGDLDRFLSPDARYGTIVTLFHGYSHDVIMNAIDSGKQWAARRATTRSISSSRRALRRPRRRERGRRGLVLDDAHARAPGARRVPLRDLRDARRDAHPDDPRRALAVRERSVHVPDAHRPERELAADRGRRRGGRRGLRHLPLQPHDRRLRRRPLAGRRGGLRDRHDRKGHHLHGQHDDRGRPLLVVLRPEVPGGDGLSARAADGHQHVRRSRDRSGVDQDHPPEVLHEAAEGGGRGARARGRRVIEARQLTKRFGGHAAIDHVSLRVERGEVVGFLGPNGAGKTTTLRVLAGVFPPSEGQALVDGHDVARAPLAARRRLGYAPERPALHAEMTVAALLAFAAAMKDVRGPRGAAVAACSPPPGSTAWATADRHAVQGFRQRVGLALALVGDPPRSCSTSRPPDSIRAERRGAPDDPPARRRPRRPRLETRSPRSKPSATAS
jgi:predicted RND superfamily exporter protein/ABC-type uncharacterized transport system YnjBCD ATPase subunit